MNLEQRVAKLERQNWMLKLLLVGAFALGCVTLLVGADEPGPREVRARRFVIIDDNGNERGSFGLYKEPGKIDHVTMLELESEDKTSRISAMAGFQSADLSLRAANKDNLDRVIETRLEANENGQTPEISMWKYDRTIFKQP